MLIYLIYNKQAKHFYHLKKHIKNQNVSAIVNI